MTDQSPIPDWDERASRGIYADIWDDEYLTEAKQSVPAFDLAVKDLGLTTTLAPDAFADAFCMLTKAIPRIRPPEEVRDDRQVLRSLDQALLDDPGIEELRDLTVGDPVGSAMTVVGWGPKMKEILERQEEQQKKAEELQRQREEAHKKRQEATKKQQEAQQKQQEAKDNPEDQKAQDEAQESQEESDKAGDEADEAEQEVEAVATDLQRDMQATELAMAASVGAMVEKAVDDRSNEQAVARAFGNEPGELQKMDPTERIKMAKVMNNDKFRKIAEFFGPMKNLVSPHMRRVRGIPSELVGLTVGTEPLERLTEEQLALLFDPKLQLTFLKDLDEGSTLLYDYEGDEEVAGGGIVCLIDSSGSMSGDPDAWAKAVAGVLFAIAKKQKRPFMCIHFNSAVPEKAIQRFRKPEDFTMDRAIEMMSTFLNGGTSFIPPLDRALQFLKEEAKQEKDHMVQSDIVMITDGEPYDLRDNQESRQYIDNFYEELEKIGGAVWGIAIDSYGDAANSWSLQNICEGKVVDVKDLMPTDAQHPHSSGQFAVRATKDVRKVFQGVTKSRRGQKHKKLAA